MMDKIIKVLTIIALSLGIITSLHHILSIIAQCVK